MTSAKSYIEVNSLHKAFGDKVILNDFNVQVHKSESFVVIGGSGTGKSVFIKCIMGLLKPDSGKISLNSHDITDLSPNDRQQIARFGMLFQGGALFDSLSVWENVAFGLMNGQNMGREEARKIALEKIDAVELSAKVADLYPAELSGGMQKRVALARAIATKPDIIFFDEPTTGLDPIVSGKINGLISKCVKELGATAITITHDMHSLRAIADRVGLLFEGKLIWTGTVSEMDTTDNPYVQQFINGNASGPFTVE
ncbi:MAG: ABC transporter ATP-binding protein [Alphaproteobacteria bacterium CG_4_10_14_0_8_um_filter_37_21]|nr:MAG: ABC transporter ATP-binding protein [Alphaproteobacteria bacterium CG_4_10_14_0_8_um_filter_37_21]